MARILIVDDDRDIRALMELTLKRSGHRVVQAEHARDAVDELRGGSFDIILMDVDMPQMDGVSFTRLLNENPRFLAFQKIPIVMVTGKDEPGVMDDSFDAGAVYFLRKPFTPNELLDTVRLVLHAPE